LICRPHRELELLRAHAFDRSLALTTFFEESQSFAEFDPGRSQNPGFDASSESSAPDRNTDRNIVVRDFPALDQQKTIGLARHTHSEGWLYVLLLTCDTRSTIAPRARRTRAGLVRPPFNHPTTLEPP
jgi:hypothetical protein